MTIASEQFRQRECPTTGYQSSFRHPNWGGSFNVYYEVDRKNATIRFNTDNIPAEIIALPEFKRFLEKCEWVVSTMPYYEYLGDPRVVALFQSSQKTLAEIMAYAKTLEDTSSFALETSRVRWKPDGDGTASTVLRYFTLGKVGDKLRLSQQESVLPHGAETLFPPELKELLRRIKDTAASLA